MPQNGSRVATKILVRLLSWAPSLALVLALGLACAQNAALPTATQAANQARAAATEPATTPVSAAAPTAGPAATQHPGPETTPAPPPGLSAGGMVLSQSELDGLVTPGLRNAVIDLRSRLKGEPGEISIRVAEQATWSNAGLGCPAPEAFYAQVLTPGIRLVLEHQSQRFDYRIAGENTRLCPAGISTEAPLERSPLPGIWASLASMPTARSEVAAVALHGKLYVVGGFGAGATANEEYDPATNVWERRAPIPRGADHGAAVALPQGQGGLVYFIGGFDGRWGPLNTVWAYDPATDQWTGKADLPTPRGALGAAVLDGKIYALGGVGTGGDLGTLEVYDPSKDTWEILSPMPRIRDHLAVVAVNGKIHALGGRQGSYANNLPHHQVYDPQTDSWEKLPDLPVARSGIAGAGVAGDIYVFGGEEVPGTFDENQRYRLREGTWQDMPPMPTARHGLGAAALGDRIYVLAGGDTPGGSQTALNEVFIVLAATIP